MKKNHNISLFVIILCVLQINCTLLQTTAQQKNTPAKDSEAAIIALKMASAAAKAANEPRELMPYELKDHIADTAIIYDSRLADTLGLWLAIQNIADGMDDDNLKINGKTPPDAARELYKNLVVLKVRYNGLTDDFKQYDRRIHEGVLICHKEVAADLKTIFALMLEDAFPIYKVIPAHKFNRATDAADGWDDEEIMKANVTSCFNFRLKTNRTAFSLHAEGRAIDINPLLNPYEAYSARGKVTHPNGANYVHNRLGSVHDFVVAPIFDAYGWTWAGRWTNPVDYQHFQKSKRSRKAYLVGDVAFKDYFYVDDATSDIYMYASPREREVDAPFCVIYNDEKPLLEQLFYTMNKINLDALLRNKGKNRFDKLPSTVFDYDLKDKNDMPLTQKTLLEKKAFRPAFPTHFFENQPLKGVNIALVEALSPNYSGINEKKKEIFVLLKTKLEAAGAHILSYKLGSDKVKTVDSINQANPHLTLILADELQYSRRTDKQNYTVAGAFYMVKTFYTTWGNDFYQKNGQYQIPFLRLMVSDDFDAAFNLAKALQHNTYDARPTEKIIRGANRGYNQQHSIMSDVEDVYYSNSAPYLAYINGAAVMIDTNREDYDIYTEKICKGVLDYVNNK